MLSILHTEASPGWGGQEIRTLKECIGLKNRGYKPVLAVNPKSPLLKKAKDEGLIVYSVPFSYSHLPSCLTTLVHIFKKEGIRLINTHSSVDAWITGILGRLWGLPVIRTRHLSTPVKGRLNAYLLYNFLANRVVTTCQRVVPVLQRQAALKEGHCLSIPTGMELELPVYSQEEITKEKQAWGFSCDQKVVGTCCVMRRWKGVEYLLRAAKLLEKQPSIRFLIVGGGVSMPYFQKISKELDLGDKVVFTGHLDNPLKAIACMDMFCLLSTGHEGVSQASLQAAYLKKPLITTLTGGLPEVCIEGKTGIIVPKEDSRSVAMAIEYLYSYPALAKQYGEQAARIVEEKFSFEHTLQGMENLIQELTR